MTNEWYCKTIICVDDEESVLESYRQILTTSEEDTELADILALADERSVKEAAPAPGQRPEYKVLMADSGVRALELVRAEMAAGGRIAAGFFDMRMPGMDGYMTIKAIMEIDPDIICTVVTAYTDRSVNQIRELFSGDHQDQLHYFKKPFDPEELAQSALNMTSAWNKKRRLEEYMRAIEMHKHGLSHILHAIGVLSCVPPQTLHSLLTGLLFQFMAFLEAEHGYAVFWTEEEDGKSLQYGVGHFENRDDLLQVIEQDANLQRSLEKNKCHIVEGRCFVPLVHAGHKLGAMYIESKNSLEHRVDRSLLEIFKTQMVQLILNSQYHQKVIKSEEAAVTDPLTGLYNRRVLMKILREELSRSQVATMQLSVVMIDLDDFKKVNDRYGHEAGDAALLKVANVLRLALRTSDLLGLSSLEHIGRNEQYAIRMGGEEFCAILLNTGLEGAKVVSERIRQNIAKNGFIYKSEEIPLFASLGIWSGELTQLDQQNEEKLNAYIDYADNAMYQAKVRGKNQVVVFEEGMKQS